MKFISIDPAMKTFGYCIIEITDTGEKTNIYKYLKANVNIIDFGTLDLSISTDKFTDKVDSLKAAIDILLRKIDKDYICLIEDQTKYQNNKETSITIATIFRMYGYEVEFISPGAKNRFHFTRFYSKFNLMKLYDKPKDQNARYRLNKDLVIFQFYWLCDAIDLDTSHKKGLVSHYADATIQVFARVFGESVK
jgi:hypothetical protein